MKRSYPARVRYTPYLYRGNAFYFENVKDMVVRGLTIRDVTREECTSNESTIGIVKSCHVGRLILRDINQVNRTDKSE